MASAIRTAQVRRNFINGQWMDSHSGRTRERRNLANIDDLVAVAPLSSREEVCEDMRVANSVKYGLSSSVHTNDSAKMFAFIDRIETGLTHVNTATTVWTEVHLPCGGTKGTWVALREIGSVAIDFFTEIKTASIDYNAQKH
jgi:acyl-CoA reductase-like NAD-dependent aldehyde dehydrogenase